MEERGNLRVKKIASTLLTLFSLHRQCDVELVAPKDGWADDEAGAFPLVVVHVDDLRRLAEPGPNATHDPIGRRRLG